MCVCAIILIANIFSCKNDSDRINQTKTNDKKSTKEVNSDDENINSDKILRFGKFEQDNNLKNGKEDIEWIIIDEDDMSTTLISRYVLYALPYDENIDIENVANVQTTWEGSSLRTWLNEEFFNESFSEEEKKFILNNTVKNSGIFGINNGIESDNVGPDTDDKVYILSKDEIRKYFGFESQGKSENYKVRMSEYAKSFLEKEEGKDFAIWHKEKKYSEKDKDFSEYWLRSGLGTTMSGDIELFSDIIEKDGHVSDRGYPFYVYKNEKQSDKGSIEDKYYKRGVRPVIKIVSSGNKKVYNKDFDNKDFETLLFGSYEQDDNAKNGKEKIEWFVINKNGNEALLLSKYILDYIEYSNVLGRQVLWNASSIRAWCNNEFYERSFDEREKASIITTKRINYDNPVYNSMSGPQSIDKVFIPGFDELMDAFNIDYDDCIKESFFDQKEIKDFGMKTTFTEYALKKYRKEKNNYTAIPLSDFWLRNQGRSGEEVNIKYNNAMSARETIDFKGTSYDLLKFTTDIDKNIQSNPKLGFRPMIVIDLSIFESQ